MTFTCQIKGTNCSVGNTWTDPELLHEVSGVYPEVTWIKFHCFNRSSELVPLLQNFPNVTTIVFGRAVVVDTLKEFVLPNLIFIGISGHMLEAAGETFLRICPTFECLSLRSSCMDEKEFYEKAASLMPNLKTIRLNGNLRYAPVIARKLQCVNVNGYGALYRNYHCVVFSIMSDACIAGNIKAVSLCIANMDIFRKFCRNPVGFPKTTALCFDNLKNIVIPSCVTKYARIGFLDCTNVFIRKTVIDRLATRPGTHIFKDSLFLVQRELFEGVNLRVENCRFLE